MKILGINSAYHESSASLVIDGKIVAAVEEERFTRIKHAKEASVTGPAELPEHSIRFCLSYAGLKASDLDGVAYSFDPSLRKREFKLDPLSQPGDWGSAEGEETFLAKLREVPNAIDCLLDHQFGDKLAFIPHHIAHAASTFYPSGFAQAAILVVDGISEAGCTLLAQGDGNKITTLDQIYYPHSLGFLWEKLSKYLGFSEYDACKLMGLAAYGDPAVFRETFKKLLDTGDKRYSIDVEVARFRLADFGAIEALFGPARADKEPILDHHRHVAAALQEATDQALLGVARELRMRTGSDKLCYAGGVALNCVSNSVIKESGLFSQMYVPTAPHDSGTAVGAALHLYYSLSGQRPSCADNNPYLGPSFSDADIDTAFRDAGLSPQRSADPARDAAKLIAEGKIVAWFQDRMEFGPRALGNRSLLADPRSASMRETLNVKVKHREEFRPLAPSVLAEEAENWFEMGQASMSHHSMLFACPAKQERRASIPAVLHKDNSARVQMVSQQSNPKFHALIKHFFDITGVPVVLNTSFNDSEPIVCTPSDAIKTFQGTAIDALFVGDRFIVR
ncbi:carbamoyltransferase [Mycetohabitans sp. B8]|uniref:carbamoyltransferase family protein n=1 Tax=Mycetohabitans sp. B8 TaxID=2841845 RepID=UPI001F1733E3|nr:carbamoyltransferase C-terminal domain-containing protein [Mycetohabitans sp. B8]MCG1043304.1 carbamoyltransferase [Mycetohabitans sp. B8]